MKKGIALVLCLGLSYGQYDQPIDGGGETGDQGPPDDDSNTYVRCEEQTTVDDCLSDGVNSTCVWTVGTLSDSCGECSITDRTACAEYVEYVSNQQYGASTQYFCDTDDEGIVTTSCDDYYANTIDFVACAFDECYSEYSTCSDTTGNNYDSDCYSAFKYIEYDLTYSDPDMTSSEFEAYMVDYCDSTDYNGQTVDICDDSTDELISCLASHCWDNTTDSSCNNDWESQGCDEYAFWEGQITVTSQSRTFEWLCLDCDFDYAFELIFPGAYISIELATDCDAYIDEYYSYYGYDDERPDDNTGGETDTGGEAGTGDVATNPNDKKKRKRHHKYNKLKSKRKLLQGGDTTDPNNGGSGGFDFDQPSTSISSRELIVSVNASFADCYAFDGVSSHFDDLQDRIEQYITDITVTVDCSRLDCCEDDDICQDSTYCDTDGDGVIDEISGTATGNGNTGDANINNVIFTFTVIILSVFFTIINL